MSQQPPPSDDRPDEPGSVPTGGPPPPAAPGTPTPYGQPPHGQPPHGQQYGQQPYGQQPYGPGYAPAPRPRTNKRDFWIGVALSIPVATVVSVVVGLFTGVVQAVFGSSGQQVSALVVGVLTLGGFVAAVVFPRTRWYAVGVAAGTATLVIVFAGACVALIAALSASY